ncbi:MAG TPA: GDSL-type esterase/lipase family protein, partial [Rhizomicrobium sp.]|nr:GDSL-type esterase/lipase family protein [Rhizomicrobium sp.]
MRIRHFGAPCALAAALILAAPAIPSALAAPAQKESWIGAWGFVPTPLPPGITPPPPVPLATLADAPLGNPPPSAIPASPPPGALLLDNPGNVPVAIADSDPSNVTVRQLVRVSVAGKQIRLRFSNEGGSDVLKLGSVHVGIAGPDGSIVAGSDHAVTFDGNANVIIPASAPLLSDPVDMKVDALQKLLISIHVPGVLSRTGHSLFQYVSPGDVSASAQMPAQRIMRLPALVTQLEVDPVSANAVVVAFGDSITEGAASTNNAFRGWPDRLAERLAAAKSKWSVVNAGIGGNRLLRYGTGQNALARLDRDVFGVAGVKAIILLEGINDIGRGFTPSGAQ